MSRLPRSSAARRAAALHEAFSRDRQGDFRHWTEREWRILARLVGHRIGPVPTSCSSTAATRAGRRWCRPTTPASPSTIGRPCCRSSATARCCIMCSKTARIGGRWPALPGGARRIHELQLVHLDLKADNVCIPLGPAGLRPACGGRSAAPALHAGHADRLRVLAGLGENLATALPIARQGEYHYQSPRLLRALEAGRRGDLQPTRQLDWRCDVFSLAAMLRRYLPDPEAPLPDTWTAARCAQARLLVRRLLETPECPAAGAAAACAADCNGVAAPAGQRPVGVAAARLGAGRKRCVGRERLAHADHAHRHALGAPRGGDGAAATPRRRTTTGGGAGCCGHRASQAMTALSAAPLHHAWRSAADDLASSTAAPTTAPAASSIAATTPAPPPTLQAASAAASAPADLVASAPVVAQAIPRGGLGRAPCRRRGLRTGRRTSDPRSRRPRHESCALRRSPPQRRQRHVPSATVSPTARARRGITYRPAHPRRSANPGSDRRTRRPARP